MLSSDKLMTKASAPAAARQRSQRLGSSGGSDRARRLLILTENFYPTDSSGGRLMTSLAEDLVKMGIDVSVLTSRGGYGGPRRVESHQSHKGIEIHRLPPGPFPRERLAGRLVNELFLTFSIFLAVLSGRRVDQILVTSSPPFLAPAAALAATMRGTDLIYVVMDVYPEMAAATGLLGRRSLAYRCWDAISRFGYRRATRTVVLGRCMKEVVRRKLGKQAPLPIVLPNWADGSEVRPIDSSALNPFFRNYPELSGKFIVQYSGNFGRFHDFETILGAAARLKNRPDIRFVLIGQGARRHWLEREVAARGLTNVALLPFQPQEELVYSMAAQDVALVTLEQGTEGLCVPSKFYPILAAGKPVIAVMDQTAEVARVVDEERIGGVVSQGDVDSLVSTIERMRASPIELREMGRRARQVQQLKFDRSGAVERYHDLLLGLDRAVSGA